MRKLVNKKHNSNNSFLRQISIGTIALLVFASSSFQAQAYYEKDPELEYLRTGKALIDKMETLYGEILLDSLVESSEPFSVSKSISNLSDYENFNFNTFSRKILLLAKSQTSLSVQSAPIRYWTNTHNRLIQINASLVLENVRQEKEADLMAAEIAADIKSRSSDPREMIELVNQYLVDNVEYPKKINYSDLFLWNSYGALVEGRAVCEGYSRAFNKILLLLDIPVINVIGTVDGEGHMWNQVFLDNQWLHVDVTFNDPVYTGRSPSASTRSQYNKKYLLLTDKELRQISSHKEHPDMAKEVVQDLFYRNNVDHLALFLKEKGLFLGDDRGFRLNDSLTRAEMAVMLVRLSGGLDEAEGRPEYYSKVCKAAFTDVPDWAAPYVGYCYENKLVSGLGNRLYGSSRLASKLDYSSVLLRVAGIYQGYTYQTSDVEAVKQGLLSKTRAAFSDLSRGDVVFMTYLFTPTI